MTNYEVYLYLRDNMHKDKHLKLLGGLFAVVDNKEKVIEDIKTYIQLKEIL